MRLDPNVAARIEDWRKRQTIIPTRTDAVRRLIVAGLDAEDAGTGPGVRMKEGRDG